MKISKAIVLLLLGIMAFFGLRQIDVPKASAAPETYSECETDPDTGEVNKDECRKRWIEEHPHSEAPGVDATDEEWLEYLLAFKEEGGRLSEDTCKALTNGQCELDGTPTATPITPTPITPTTTTTPITPTVTTTPITPTVTTTPITPTATTTPITPTVTTTPITPTVTTTPITPTVTTTPVTPTATTTPITPTATRPSRENAFYRVNFEVGNSEARRGAYVVREVGGRVLGVHWMDQGWVDSGDWVEVDITHESVYVQVFFVKGDGSPEVELTILNPAPGTTWGWLSRGDHHALEVIFPNTN